MKDEDARDERRSTRRDKREQGGGRVRGGSCSCALPTRFGVREWPASVAAARLRGVAQGRVLPVP